MNDEHREEVSSRNAHRGGFLYRKKDAVNPWLDSISTSGRMNCFYPEIPVAVLFICFPVALQLYP
jgi:hypothetical protein